MIFLVVNRYKALCIVSSLLFTSGSLLCQCPGIDFFREKINTIYTSQEKPEIQLQGLLRVQQQMKACNLNADSCYMYLFQKIGVVYSKQSNYEKAVDFTERSISE